MSVDGAIEKKVETGAEAAGCAHSLTGRSPAASAAQHGALPMAERLPAFPRDVNGQAALKPTRTSAEELGGELTNYEAVSGGNST